MPSVKVPIQSLNGGISRRSSLKRLPQETQEADNVLLSVERSAEKRPPISHIDTGTEGDYLDIPYVSGGPPPTASGISDPALYYNTDNLYYHFIDVDGANRYCIIINRAVENTKEIVTVYRIEPTQWVKENFEYQSFDRGLKEYIQHFNLKTDSTPNLSIDEIMGSVTFGAGAVFYNKQKELKFLPDNSSQVKVLGSISGFQEPHPGYIHSGDKFKYKTADMFFVDAQGNQANGATVRFPNAIEEDEGIVPYQPSKDDDLLYSKWISTVASTSGGGYKNVDEDIESRVNSATLVSFEVGHSLENFSKIPIPPPTDDVDSHAGWKAQAAMKHLYHRRESGIPNTVEAGSAAATGTITLTDNLPADGTSFVLKNTDTNVQLFNFKFKTSEDHVHQPPERDLDGNYIIGLNGITSGQVNVTGAAVAQRIKEVLTYLQPITTFITPTVDTSTNVLAKVVALTMNELGTFGNEPITTRNAQDVAATIPDVTVAGFTGGTDAPDYGYLSSPFSSITRTDSVYQYDGANSNGKGEIWYARDSYFTFPSGFYRTVGNVNTGQPYYQPVRAEDKNSVVDHRTFPVIIRKESDGVWRIRYCPLLPKQNGSAINNPGPTAINSEEKIKAIEFWKNRLWIATETTIFSSSVNDYFNFFIDDIQNITDTDPIDITVNTGQFNLVQSLTSFQNFLFITTQSGNQFEVRGSATNGGAISPTTVELRSTSFYSTASTANPVKMGNNIFFFDTERLFIYSGTDSFGNEYGTAFELSQHAHGYLPVNYQVTTAIPSMNTLAMVDRDAKNNIYFYTAKTNGQELVQSAFYRWVLDPQDLVQKIHGFEGAMYTIVKRSNGSQNAIYPYYASLEPVTLATPLLDRLVKLGSSNITYNSDTNLTEVQLPYYDPNATEVVLGDDWGTKAYTRHKASAVTSIDFGSHFKTKLTFPGNLASQRVSNSFVNRSVWAGRPYTMSLELSPIHYRDNNNNAQPGVLTLKRVTTHHKDTAQYEVEIKRYNRTASTVRSEAFSFNDTTDLLGSIRIESEGELLSKVMGNADSTTITIKSDFPTPCNITGLEVIANYRPGNTSIQK